MGEATSYQSATDVNPPGTGTPESGSPAPGEAGGEQLIAGKFKTQDELVAAYLELASKSEGNQGATENHPASDTAADGTNDGAAETLEQKGLSLGDFEAEYALTGSLSEESYQKLEKAGIPKTVVDSYIEAVSFKATAMRQEIFGLTGGEQGYQAMAQWASTNLSEAELDAFNRVVEGSDFNAAKIAVMGLYSKYGQAVGTEGRRIEGTPTTSVADVFKSNAEVIAAMKDPRYKNDSSYRDEVTKKLARSNVLI